MPAATGSNRPTSPSETSGTDGTGRPAGMVPTMAIPRRARSNAATTAVAATTATSAPGTFGANRRSTRMSAKELMPTARVGPWMSPRLVRSCPRRGKNRSAVIGIPVRPAIWLLSSVSPTPGDVSDQDRLGEQRCQEAEASDGGHDADGRHDQCERAHQRDVSVGVARRDRAHAGGGEDGRSRLRPDPEMPAAPDHGVHDQRADDGVEPELGRQPRQLGVGHRLRARASPRPSTRP